MRAPVAIALPPYPGYYREDLAEAARAHSLINRDTETANGMHKEMLLADLEATAKVLEGAPDPTYAIHLRQEMKRLR